MTTTAPPVPTLAEDPALPPRVELGGSRVDLMGAAEAVARVVDRAARPQPHPLAVVSVNLDHVHHFGHGARWHGVLEQAEESGRLDVLSLLDGMPLVHAAERLTGRSWPRLAGSDLIGPLLDGAERAGVRVGFLGGSEETQLLLRDTLAVRRPQLRVAGWWSPPRAVLTDAAASQELAAEIAAVGVDLLVVGMGKPRQELWIAEHGAATGASVLLAFGAVVDFLAEKVSRAPQWVAQAGLEQPAAAAERGVGLRAVAATSSTARRPTPRSAAAAGCSRPAPATRSWSATRAAGRPAASTAAPACART